MKQLLILSGKGGTGKTTIASAFIKLSQAQAYADCDVDAPNLHLVMDQKTNAKNTEFFGLSKAKIDPTLCTNCGRCKEHCRFDAISYSKTHSVNPFACEGCSVCALVCPSAAISFVPSIVGKLILYSDNKSAFSTAQLEMGSGTSGKLVSEVKKQLKSASIKDVPLAIIDGSPGIGCPVIASLSGVDMVLIVAEPSISGISDMGRIIKTAQMFNTKIGVCINRYDTNLESTKKIENFCIEKNLFLTGKIPFDPDAINAINQGLTIVDIECPSGTAVQKVYTNTVQILFDNKNSNKDTSKK